METMGTPGAARAEYDTRRRLRTVTRATALLGGPLFLLGVLLHPARDGAGVAAGGAVYGLTHDLQALALLLQAVGLVGVYVLGARGFGPGGVPAFLAALVGTVLWFGLIVLDGSLNPVLARDTPELVHRVTTTADLNVGAALIGFPALLVFPVGYLLLARLLTRHGAAWPGAPLGLGAVVYTTGGLAIFALGPESPAVQLLEVAGAAPYALGFVQLGRRWGHAQHAQQEPGHPAASAPGGPPAIVPPPGLSPGS